MSLPIKRIQLLACNLGSDFAMLCMIYYLLYGSEISAIICLNRSYCSTLEIKKSLINDVKLIFKFSH